MIFDEYFDDVYIITLPDKKARLERTLKGLIDGGLCENPKIVRAISGDIVGVSAWFSYGGGALGCMMSHIRIIQDFIMDYNFFPEQQASFGDKKILILEDDVIFDYNAKERFKIFTENLPDDWGQFYLGGQHIYPPKYYNKEVLIGSSINRTHAYAIRGKAAQRIHKHITFYPDYTGNNHHVDHQFEVAHRRGDWKVYCPLWWIAGQGENHSDISGKRLPNKWWDYRNEHDLKDLPLFVAEENAACNGYMQYLHFGDNEDEMKPIEVFLDKATQEKADRLVNSAWDQRKFPAIFCKNFSLEKMEILKKIRRGQVLSFETDANNLETMYKNYSKWKK
jgi:hypothetical protein